MKYLILLYSTLLCISVLAVSNQTKKESEAFVKLYNAGNFKKIYQSLSPSLRKIVSFQEIIAHYKGQVKSIYGNVKRLLYTQDDPIAIFQNYLGYGRLKFYSGDANNKTDLPLIEFTPFGSPIVILQSQAYESSSVFQIVNSIKRTSSDNENKLPVGQLIIIPVMMELANQIQEGIISEYDTVLRQDISPYILGAFDRNCLKIPFDDQDQILLTDLISFTINNPTLCIIEYLIEIIGQQKILTTSKSKGFDISYINYPSSYVIALATSKKTQFTQTKLQQYSSEIHKLLLTNYTSDRAQQLLNQTITQLSTQAFSKIVSQWNQNMTLIKFNSALNNIFKQPSSFQSRFLSKYLWNPINLVNIDKKVTSPICLITSHSKFEFQKYIGFTISGNIQGTGPFAFTFYLYGLTPATMEDLPSSLQYFCTLFVQDKQFRDSTLKSMK